MRGSSLRVRALMFMVLLWATLLVPAAQAHDPAEAALGDVREVVAGHGHSCAVTNEGRAYCWGYNTAGQLGDGSTTARHFATPVAIPQTKFVTQISPGRNHSCAVTLDGNVYCWGDNSRGEIGDGTTVNRLLPTQVLAPLGDAYTQVGVGLDHTCAVTLQSKVYCWGRNDTGGVGDGTNVDRLTPTLVSPTNGLTQGTVRQVTAGLTHSCAVTWDGAMYCWGYNFYGQLGDGTNVDRVAPVRVAAAWLAASVDSTATAHHTCGVSLNAEAYCWGDNAKGQLGDGTIANRNTPGAVFGGSGLAPGTVGAISVGQHTACASTLTAKGYCWGWNTLGEVGDGTTTQRFVPTAIAVGEGLQFVRQTGAGGNAHNCATSLQGQAYCWGSNFTGQVGDGTTTDRLTPVKVNVVTRPHEPTYDDVSSCAGGGHGDCPATAPQEDSAAEPQADAESDAETDPATAEPAGTGSAAG